jgi:hypothetical protein
MKLINCKDIEKKLPLSNFDDFVDENYENNNIIYIIQVLIKNLNG